MNILKIAVFDDLIFRFQCDCGSEILLSSSWRFLNKPIVCDECRRRYKRVKAIVLKMEVK